MLVQKQSINRFVTVRAACDQGVAEGRLTVGDAVLFITLMQQLYGPLNYFGSYCARLAWGRQHSCLLPS